MTDRIEVCPTKQLPPGTRKIVRDGNVSIGVFNVDGDHFAVLNTCRHQHGPLCNGKVIPELEVVSWEIGEYPEERMADENRVLVCPWHGWTYNIETGEHTGDSDISVPTFDVVVEDGTIFVEVG